MKTNHINTMLNSEAVRDEKLLAKVAKSVLSVRKVMANEDHECMSDFFQYYTPSFMGRAQSYIVKVPSDVTLRHCGRNTITVNAYGKCIADYSDLDVNGNIQITYVGLRGHMNHLLYHYSKPLFAGDSYLKQLISPVAFKQLHDAIQRAIAGVRNQDGVYAVDHYEYCFPVHFEDALPTAYRTTFLHDLQCGDNDSAVVTIRMMCKDFIKSFQISNIVTTMNRHLLNDWITNWCKTYIDNQPNLVLKYLDCAANAFNTMPTLVKKIYNMQGWRSEKCCRNFEAPDQAINTIYVGLHTLRELGEAVQISDIGTAYKCELRDYLDSLELLLGIAYCNAVLENLSESRPCTYYSKHGFNAMRIQEDLEPASLVSEDDED